MSTRGEKVSLAPRPSSLIRAAVREGSSRITLFCLPHAGAGSASFRGWADALGPDIEVATVQMPGREDRLREPPYETMEDAVAPIALAMAPWLDKPFAVFGHSLGALVAFEVVHRVIREYGVSPVVFIPSACRAPFLPHPLPPISHLPDGRFLESFQAQYGGIPPAILKDHEYLKAFLAPLRGDFRILEAHRFIERPMLSCSLLVFGGARDRVVSTKNLEGWQALSSGDFHLSLLNAGHLYLQTHRQGMTKLIRDHCLRKLGGT